MVAKPMPAPIEADSAAHKPTHAASGWHMLTRILFPAVHALVRLVLPPVSLHSSH